MPVSTSVTAVARSEIEISCRIIGRLLADPGGRQHEVDDLDSEEGSDDAADAVDEERAAEEGGGPERPVAHAAERERDQQDDDEGVEDHRGEDGAVGRGELHHIEWREL